MPRLCESWEYESDTNDFISNGYTLESTAAKEARGIEVLGPLIADMDGLQQELARGMVGFVDREKKHIEEKQMTANEKKMGSSKNQKELMQNREMKPITFTELSDNEYFDVHSG